MKKLIFALAIAAIPVVLQAQDTYSGKDSSSMNNSSSMNKSFIWSIGIEPSIPFGHFNRYSDFGLGGSFQGEYKPGRTGITLSLGYIDYFGKTTNGVSYSDFKYWPLLGGIKYYMGKSYLHGQAGAGFGSKGLGTSFWYGAGIGLNFSKVVDAELKYTGWKQRFISNSSPGGGGYIPPGGGGYGGHYPTIGLRLGINF